MTDSSIAFIVINQDYYRLTNGVMGVTALVYEFLNNSNSTDKIIVKSTQQNPKFTIDELNKFYVKCVNGNLTGSKLWIAYKFSDKDMYKLLKNVKDWNKDMIADVNSKCIPGYVQNHEILIPTEQPPDKIEQIFLNLFH